MSPESPAEITTVSKWFGAYWPSALTWAEPRIATPVQACYLCQRVFEPGEQGILLPSPFEDDLFDPGSIEGRTDWLARSRSYRNTALAFHRTCLSDFLLQAAFTQHP